MRQYTRSAATRLAANIGRSAPKRLQHLKTNCADRNLRNLLKNRFALSMSRAICWRNSSAPLNFFSWP